MFTTGAASRAVYFFVTCSCSIQRLGYGAVYIKVLIIMSSRTHFSMFSLLMSPLQVFAACTSQFCAPRRMFRILPPPLLPQAKWIYLSGFLLT
jgi:hypothetical protein